MAAVNYKYVLAIKFQTFGIIVSAVSWRLDLKLTPTVISDSWQIAAKIQGKSGGKIIKG